MTDQRAVSPVFGYTLTLGITTLLIVGLVMAASGYVDDQREQVGQSELEVIGQQVSSDISAADRLSRTEGAADASVGRNMQSRVVGSPYTIHIRENSETALDGPTEYYLELTKRQPDITVIVGITSQRPLRTTSLDGGAIRVQYDSSTDELVVQNV